MLLLLQFCHLTCLLDSVTYSYDELGRLVGAVAATGDSVRYSYDAVGNILSITRYSASQFALFTFSPKSGPVGTNVTISGSNFSSNSAQDSVTFNGTNATIISATPTTLVVSVPVGATSGSLTISSPSGSTTTSDSFTVTNSDGKPRIDSFTPQIVAPGNRRNNSRSKFRYNACQRPADCKYYGGVESDHFHRDIDVNDRAICDRIRSHFFKYSKRNCHQFRRSFYPAYRLHRCFRWLGGTDHFWIPTIETLSTANQTGLLVIDGKKGQMISAVASGSTFGSGCSFFLYNPFNAAVIDSRGSGSTQASGSCASLADSLIPNRYPPQAHMLS